MSFTKRQLVEAAYGELALAAYTFDLSPDEIQAGLQRIEGMLRTWKNQGIDTGYVFPLSPAVSDPDDSSGMLDFYEEAVRTNGAIRIAPLFGKTVSAETRLAASLAYQSMLVGRPVPVMQLPRNLPVGAANRWGGGPGYFTPCLPAGVSDPSVSSQSTCDCKHEDCCSSCIDEVTKMLIGNAGAGYIGFDWLTVYEPETVGWNLTNQPISVTDSPFSAIGDGLPHPLSEYFQTLEQAQAVYPHARSLSDSRDWAAIQGALNTGRTVYLPKPISRYALNQELIMYIPGQRMFGDNPGTGQQPQNYTSYCGLEWFGTGEKYVHTRRVPRVSSSDPMDAPISCCLSVQAEGVRLEGFSILTKTDSFTNPNDYGADWDVGLFHGCRAMFRTIDVHVVAYNRIANYYQDVTRAAGLSELPNPYGISYAKGAVVSGSDGVTHHRPLWSGGRWAELRLGAIRNLAGTYYNEVTQTLIADGRGGSGASDYVVYNGHLRGGVHHSNRRWVDPVTTPLSGPSAEGLSAGAQYIDSYAGISAARITKQTYSECRFLSEQVFVCRLDRVGNIRYPDCHWEFSNRSIIPAAGGAPIDPADDVNYGYGTLAITDRTGTVTIIAPSTNEPSETWFWNVVQTVSPTTAKKMLIGSDGGNIRMDNGQLIMSGTSSISGGLRFGESKRLSGVDLNTLDVPGFYRVTTPVNGPVGTSSIFLNVFKNDTGDILQQATLSGGGAESTDVTFFRKYAGSWRTWKRLITTLDKPVTRLASSAVAVSGTAVTTEEVYATITIPAGAMGPNGTLRINMLWSSSLAGGSKNLKIRLGGIGGVDFLSNNITTTNMSTTVQNDISNRGNESSQVGRGLTLTSFGGTANPVVTASINTAISQTLLLLGQKSVAADTLTLESYSVELLP